jgi:hypothetical protein
MPSQAIPYVLQNDYLSVVVGGRSYPVSKGQPTFKALHKALSRENFSRVPKLLSLATQIAERSHGKVNVTADGVTYKGQKVENVLTTKVLELIEHGKPVAHLLRFMDNLYLNPDADTVNEVYEWLSNGRFALTDDGCFLAYKKVRNNFMDIRTGRFDNRPGRPPVVMPRKAVDPDRRRECSRGLHFCSKAYLPNFGSAWREGGSRIVEVKVNPADVVAIPVDYGYSKGRTWRYEVLREVEYNEMIEGRTDTPVMMQPVVELSGDRQELIKQVKALPSVKRLLKRGKMTSASFKKASVARLKNWLRRFSRMDIAPAQSKLFANPLRFHREAAGKTLGEVAKAADMKLSEVYNAERALHPEQETIDKILMAIATLRGYNFPLDNGYYAVDDSDVEDDDEYDDEFDDSDDDYEDEDDSELDDDDEDDDY